MNIQIRRIGIDDAPALSAIAKRTFFDTFAGTCTESDMQGYLDKYYNIGQLENELRDISMMCYFAEFDGVPIGYFLCKESSDGFSELKKYKALELKRIYVLESYHGKGVAPLMMNFFLDLAQENAYELTWLGVWEHNIRAQRFYAKYGFTNSGYNHFFPIGNTPQTDILMWKFL